jgi:XTP/dITP diphosphohydrolase
VYLATKNAGKREEFAALFAGTPIVLRTYDAYRDPIEGESSYIDNAALKANALREQLLVAGIVADVLSDDSGMEVDALDGRPGVITADYGGAGLSWAERRRVVLDELAALGETRRDARFVCYLHFIAADGTVASQPRTAAHPASRSIRFSNTAPTAAPSPNSPPKRRMR